jgi:type II secretory pathway component PulK
MTSPLRVLKNKSGVALLIVITTVALVAFIAAELSYDSVSEYIIAAQEVNHLKARYAAKAGIEISLLRINIYKQAVQQFGQALGNNKGLLDKIWQVPFIWPPVLPEEASGIDKSAMTDAVGESLMDAVFTSNITSESSKIDLTDLVSPSKVLQDTTRNALVRLLENRLQEEDDFAKRNRDLQVEQLVDNITDWMDADTIGRSSGDESAPYARITDAKLPPNQPFKTLDELHMVAGMTDEIFDFLAPQVTIYGAKAIQVNHASKEVLMSLSPVITKDVADKIDERRNNPNAGPFADENDFFNFLSNLGINTETIKDQFPPMVFDQEYNFRIQSIGTFGRTSSEIIAIVYDFDKVKEKLTESLKNDAKLQQGQTQVPTAPQPPTPPATPPAATGQPQPSSPNRRPNIVYWTES